ncbi:MAG: FAD-dependent oxidoreductase [Armatimonadota bacterium]
MTDEAQKRYECDVLVIGAGVSGYCAAIQAGRCGCETILIEKDEVLGGNAGPKLGVGITGAARYNPYATETGILQEIREEACWADAFTHTIGRTNGYSISRRFEAVVQQFLEDAKVTTLKRHYARRPIMDGERIAAVMVEDMAAFQTVRIEVRDCVIEASGDGEIGVRAGADFDMGSEGRDEFGERSAPAQRTDEVQGTSLVAIAHKTDREVTFIPPAGTPELTPRVWMSSLSSYLHHHGGWFAGNELMFLYVTETGGHMDTIGDDAEIYETLLQQLWAEWDHIKNGPHAEEARNWDLLWVSPKAGKRESRRLMGDYVLTQHDVEQGRRFDDDIAYGGHDLDDHKPLDAGSNIVAVSIPPMYGIPYRCCYSRNIGNLLLAGRLISATHLAHSSSRIMATGAAIGQAVGTAAWLCHRHGCSPREVYRHHIDVLQERLLADDATLLGKPHVRDADLARDATLTATSELRLNDLQPGRFVPLIADAGVVLWDWPQVLESMELYVRNASSSSQELTVRIDRARRDRRWKTKDEFREFGRNDLRDEAFERVYHTDAAVPAGHEGWVSVDTSGLELGATDAACDDDRLLISLAENQSIEWAVTTGPCPIAGMVEHSHTRPRWSMLGEMAAIRLRPAPPVGEAANAVNEYTRRLGTAPTNMWMSDPDRGMPQELRLQWDEPQAISRVELVFDTLYRDRHDAPWESRKRAAAMCARDYDIIALTDDGWRRIAATRGNHNRRRSHEMKPLVARGLRIRVLSAHDNSYGARIYRVSVFE